ncbi:MAG: ribonucleotide reductase N-terminal alpha domain-containing protein [bacterium]
MSSKNNPTKIELLLPLEIIKRDGRKVPFDAQKIIGAITMSGQDTGQYNPQKARQIAQKVLEKTAQKFNRRSVPTVEQIQDIVEPTIAEFGYFATAKHYILYRYERQKIREVRASLGLAPDAIKVFPNALKVLESRYLLRDQNRRIIESPEGLFRRVAKFIASAEKKYHTPSEKVIELEQKFYELMASFKFLPNSPTLMNANTRIGQLSACFVLPVEDSMEGVFNAVKWTALVHQTGGGTGFSFSRLRPKDDLVASTSGKASGPISFMAVFNAATETVKQGGRRRGANMGILRVDHPDILDFINAKEREGNLSNFNISVALTDKFFEALEKGGGFELINPRTRKPTVTLKAANVFELIVTSAWRNGEPGVIFIDRINAKNFVPNAGEIEATNPCLTGDTLIPTQNGLERFDTLVEVKKGCGPIVDRRVTGESGVAQGFAGVFFDRGTKRVFRVTTKAGYTVKATADHKMYTKDGIKQVCQLSVDDELLIQSGQGVFKKTKKGWSKELGQVLGWLIGDGWLIQSGHKNCRVGWTFGGKEKDRALSYFKPVLNELYGVEIKEVERTNNVCHLSYHSKKFVSHFEKLGILSVTSENKRVPLSIYTASYDAVVGFLQGLFTADGTANFVEGKSAYVRLTSKSKALLLDVQILLINLGIFSKIYNRSRKPRKAFGNYISDGVLYELEISKDAVPIFLDKVGFMFDKGASTIEKFKKKSFYKVRFYSKVSFVEELGPEPVYDLTENTTHSFIANGIVVSNCGEQPLVGFESCNLGSINLAKFVKDRKVDWQGLEETVRLSVRFLDNVVDKNKYPLPQIRQMTLANRKIGLGVMGFADMLIALEIAYNSEEGVRTAEKVMRFITEKARDQSRALGHSRGSFPNFKGSKLSQKYRTMRNATVTTVAPTGSISIIANASSGVEPLFALCFVRTNILDADKLVEVNKTFEEVAKREGFYSQELVSDLAHHGCLLPSGAAPERWRRVFVTSHDISPEYHIKMQSAFQRHTDNAVSKTINFPKNATVEDVKKAYLMAYRLGCKGLTVYRDGSRSEQVLNIGTAKVEGELCPKCQVKMETKEGCTTCPTCGYSTKCNLA